MKRLLFLLFVGSIGLSRAQTIPTFPQKPGKSQVDFKKAQPKEKNFLIKQTKANTKLDVISQMARNMIDIPGGSFAMGRPDDPNGRKLHKVTLDNFMIGKYEVTQKEWTAVMKTNPASNQGCDDCPIENVSWVEVQTFLTELNKLSGKSYRLPTEAEWEYAAKGGQESLGYIFSGGKYPKQAGWYNENTSKSRQVGQKLANELGLYDMSGNVWELCSDWNGGMDHRSAINPKGPPDGSYKVVRGGSYKDSFHYLSVTYVLLVMDFQKLPSRGFRIVLSN